MFDGFFFLFLVNFVYFGLGQQELIVDLGYCFYFNLVRFDVKIINLFNFVGVVFEICDMIGCFIFSGKIVGKEMVVNLNGLLVGMYFVNIEGNNGGVQLKFIKLE